MFNVSAFIKSLPIMAKGMAGIFIVTLVIVIIMSVLVKVTRDKSGD